MQCASSGNWASDTSESTLYVLRQTMQPGELQAILQQMYLLYGNAHATIYAMGGASADAGLPRITLSSDGHGEPTASLGGVTVVASDFYGSPKKRWATHAWTYQELFYSTRCTLFAANCVLNSCGHGLHSEERERSISITCGFDTILLHHQPEPRYPAKSPGTPNATSFGDYAVHIASFAERQLSYQSDALKALIAKLADMSTKPY
jgi:hypothetical protein